MLAEAPAADVIVMTAAVADFRPVARADAEDQEGRHPPAPDRADGEPGHPRRPVQAPRASDGPAGQVIVGFAAETNPDLDAARAKLARKGCDLLVVNQVGNGQGFGATDNEWLVLDADGTVTGISAPVEGRPGRRRTDPGHRPPRLTRSHQRPRPLTGRSIIDLESLTCAIVRRLPAKL